MTTPPSSNVDLFSDDALVDPYPIYREIRETAPLVYLPSNDLHALTRYEHVRAALDDWETFSSAQGVAFNDTANAALKGAIIHSDPPAHTQLRKILRQHLAPRALADLVPTINAKADDLVASLVRRRHFDAVADLAQTFPVSVLLEMLGFPEEGRERLVPWGAAAFNAAGPDNERTSESLPALAELTAWLREMCTPEKMIPGGLATTVHDASARGDLPPDAVIPLISAYVIPAFDTTISAIGNAIWLFAHRPDQWDLLCEDPSLIPSAFNEVLRVETPIQMFARLSTTAYTVDGARLQPGSRIALLFASANRGERHYPDADTFDITRAAGDHVAFGYGVHNCPGQGLARMQGHAVLGALSRRVRKFTLNGKPQRRLNNLVRSLTTLPVSVA
jgi:cytochrome P450